MSRWLRHEAGGGPSESCESEREPAGDERDDDSNTPTVGSVRRVDARRLVVDGARQTAARAVGTVGVAVRMVGAVIDRAAVLISARR